ncbi:LuxR C-terminal-related transcriptional regulator [Amycolatopsis taiwanensis]|uniref:LuxR family transcriptional regulator n=1 Tax=Amycolatopsis taiwanensis TaxID=342230 RepID=A0A9W6VJ83_9PSEU|nr:LuxR C-terminal-related transcriptional regulator [Amycolatopsis taiwanensis]GLY69249.1 LuxR family transcriptional regulator [Amycolatopsis taiwanensis]
MPEPKITQPPPPRELIRRARPGGMLPDVAEPEDDPAVTVVSAPAGFGKTTLVSSWADDSRRTAGPNAVVWVNVDEADNDVALFFAGVLAAFNRSQGGTSAGRVPEPRRTGQDSLTLLAELVERRRERVWLVLDDFQTLREPAAVQVVDTLLRRMPRNQRLVLCGRVDPPIGLQRLRIAGRLRELGADDLAFSRAETAEAIALHGIHLSEEHLDRLISLTEGWPAAIRLAAQALRGSRDPGSVLDSFVETDHAVAEYLTGEVLSPLPEDQQDFLRRTSVPDRITPGLARALTGREDAAAVLGALARTRSLISRSEVDSDRYRQHAFLRAYLQADLRRRMPTVLAELHRIAARWFAEHGEPVTAVAHAASAHDTELATNLVTKHGLALILAGELATLRRLAATLPARARADAEVGLILTLTDLAAADRATAEMRLSGLAESARRSPSERVRDLDLIVRTHWARPPGRVAPALEELGERVERITDPDLLMLALINRGTAMFWLGEAQAAGRDLGWALRIATAHEFDHATLHCLTHLAAVASLDSDYPRMRRMVDEALQFAERRSLSDSPAASFAYTIAATVAYQYLESDRAAELAGRAIDVLGSAGDRTAELCAVSIDAAIDFEWGQDPHSALVRLRRQWGSVNRQDAVAPTLVAHLAPIEQRMALRLGRPDWAAEAERRASAWVGDHGEAQLLRARMHAHYGRVTAARALLEKITKNRVPCLLVSSRIEAHVLAAMLAERAHDGRSANLEIRAAIELAEPRRALRPFYDAGQEIRQLLVPQLGRLGRLDPFVEEVLEAIPPAPAGVTAELTPREVQLLRELPSLATIEEIAGSLYVSVNTVKTHLRNVYRKLGVTSRRDAVIAARERGLL